MVYDALALRLCGFILFPSVKGNLGIYEAAILGVEMGTLDAIIARLKVFTILAKSLLAHLILFASSSDFNKNIKGSNLHP